MHTPKHVICATLVPLLIPLISVWADPGRDDEPIRVEGTESESVNLLYSDGTLPPLVGTHNIQILRATKDAPELAEGLGYTYNHHLNNIYYHNGAFYVEWGSGEKDEEMLPYRRLVATSGDGLTWSKPVPLYERLPKDPEHPAKNPSDDFTNGVDGAPIAGEAQDAYRKAVDWYRNQPQGLMLQKTPWRRENIPATQAHFDSLYKDWRTNHPDDHAIPSVVAGALGKGANYFRRKDGQWVFLSKWAWTSLSPDDGQTWTKPVIPPTVKTGHQKISGYRAAEDCYFLFYDPVRSSAVRWPLVAVQGQDGITFGRMGVVHGEVPDIRYKGRWKDMGTQYNRVLMGEGPIRGAIWVVYSVNKEDIWISRVPLGAGTVVREPVQDNFDDMPVGPLVANWNIYRPQWAPVDVIALEGTGNHALQLKDADPYDYCRAVRVFPAGRRLHCAFKVRPGQSDHGRLEIELLSRRGLRPVRLVFDENGKLRAREYEWNYEICTYKANEWMSVQLNVDLDKPTWQVVINDAVKMELQWAYEPERRMDGPVPSLERISFRTGEYRRLGKCIHADMTFYPEFVESYAGVAPGSDRPITPAVFLIDDVRIDGKFPDEQAGKKTGKDEHMGM